MSDIWYTLGIALFAALGTFLFVSDRHFHTVRAFIDLRL